MINTNIPLDKHGQNANIKCELSLDQLITYWFIETKDRKSVYLIRNLGSNISFNLRITKQRDVIIQVIDEDVLYQFDYQESIIKNNLKNNAFALDIHERVQNIMRKLVKDGIIVGYNENDYI